MIITLRSKNADYPDLSEGQQYFVLGIEADDYRILNDAGKPYLYPPPELFEITDANEPDYWLTETGDDGERYAYPEPLNQAGFFEDFFDQKYEQVAIFWHVVNRQLSNTA